jgi:hypothetical protein
MSKMSCVWVIENSSAAPVEPTPAFVDQDVDVREPVDHLLDR